MPEPARQEAKSPRSPSGLAANALLAILSLVITWLVAELVLNALEKPSPWSSGVILNQELPPSKIIPTIPIPSEQERLKRASEWYPSLIVDGRKITYGDLHGIAREDIRLGHAPLENAISANGWWQANALGARSRSPITTPVPDGKSRLLLFGDSYTHGSRVPQEETFANFLDVALANVEVVNFAVDGYSMSQAYLRYETLKHELDHDFVFLVIVPEADLWREINCVRYIARGWESYKINPRFLVEDGQLRLVQSPYPDLDSMLRENVPNVTDTLRRHLQRYDRFYLNSRFEPNPVLDHLITFRLIKRWRAKRERIALLDGLMDPPSEALQVTQAIARAMAESAGNLGADFALVFLPGPVEAQLFPRDPSYQERWARMRDFLCADLPKCHDLMEDFARKPPDPFDTGYEGSHYGPSVNASIARFLSERAFPDSSRQPISGQEL